jgi:hypothetical protein
VPVSTASSYLFESKVDGNGPSFHYQINLGLERTIADPTVNKGCQFEVFAVAAVLPEKEEEYEHSLISINRMDLPRWSSDNPKRLSRV